MAARIIVRGDDCGSCMTANLAIEDAVGANLLKNVSVMATGSCLEDAATRFAERDDLCFGIHLTMNAEWDHVKWGPVLPSEQVRSLVDEHGYFWRDPSVMLRNGASLDHVMRECDAQLERLRSDGFRISYADEHMFFGHAVPGFPQAFDSWCKKQRLINFRRWYKELPGLKINDSLDYHLQVLDLLEPEQVYTMILHPGFDNEEMRSLGSAGYPGSQIAAERNADRLFAVDRTIEKVWRDRNIISVRYDELEDNKWK